MRARQALNPGRIKLTFEDGSTKYAVMERADNPVVEGDPLNPYTLLKDETCTMLGGNPETMVPDDAFSDARGACGPAAAVTVMLAIWRTPLLRLVLSRTAAQAGTALSSASHLRTRQTSCAKPKPLTVSCRCRTSQRTVFNTVCGRRQAERTMSAQAPEPRRPTRRQHSSTESTTTATAVKIRYMAIEYGGER